MFQKMRRKPRKTLKATPRDIYKFWKETLEDIYYSEQQAIVQMHISPQDFNSLSMEEWNNIMSAKAKKDRPVDMGDWIYQQMALGKTRKEV